LHVIVADSTMSEVSTHLRFATTDLVLRAIESGRALPALGLHDHTAAIRAAARGLTGTAPPATERGRPATARDIQPRSLDHDSERAHSVFHALQRRGLAPQVLDEARIEAARSTAPTSTRAHLRGQVVTAAQEHGVDHVVDWTTLRLTRPGAMPVQVLDPFAT